MDKKFMDYIKENIKEYLDEQGLVPVPTIEAAEAGIKALYL